MERETTSPAEEKKDETTVRKNTAEDSSGDEEDQELVSLSSDLWEIFGDRKFDTEEDLRIFMEEQGIADCRIVLMENRPRQIRPTDQHNSFTSQHVFEFARFHGTWGYVSGTHNVHLSTHSHREPDISFFGYPRCIRNSRGALQPCNKGAVPDVVIQFSWKDKKGYKEQAMNDMMTSALDKERGTPSLGCPRVGYLIKVKFSKKRRLSQAVKGSKTQDLEGLDIYRLPWGTTIDNAIHGVNGASKWTYFPNSGSDSEIHIRPSDLGITGFWSRLLWSGYRIKLSDLFDEMNRYHMERQQEGLAT